MARCSSYIEGECTRGACEAAGWIPDALGDAGDWAAHAIARGFQVTSIPTVGAAACYARGDGYSAFGHCGIVRQVFSPTSFLIYEMNFSQFNTYDSRVSSTFDVAGFILPPGVSPGGGAGPGGSSSPGSDALAAAWGDLQYWANTGGPQMVQAFQVAAAFTASLRLPIG